MNTKQTQHTGSNEVATGFTPGPWVADMQDGHRMDRHLGPIVRTAYRPPVQDLGDVVAFVSYESAPGGDGKECQANARLIAAAPDLLAALQTLVGIELACAPGSTLWEASMDDARAALGKAGQS